MSKERYEIATYVDRIVGGNGLPHSHHKLTVDNYGEGKYIINNTDNSKYMLGGDKSYTEPLSESLIEFVKSLIENQKNKINCYCDGRIDIDFGLIKTLSALQYAAKEMNMYKNKMEEEIEKRVKAKEAELEEEFQRRIRAYKEDFGIELELARNIIESNKKWHDLSVKVLNESDSSKPKAEDNVKKYMNNQQQTLIFPKERPYTYQEFQEQNPRLTSGKAARTGPRSFVSAPYNTSQTVPQEKWEKESHFEHAQEVWVSKTGEVFDPHGFDTQEQLVDAWRNGNKLPVSPLSNCTYSQNKYPEQKYVPVTHNTFQVASLTPGKRVNTMFV